VTIVRRPGPRRIAKLGEKGRRTLHQAQQHRHRQGREGNQVDREQKCRKATKADEAIGDRDDAGGHDEGKAAARKIADEPSDRG